MTLVRDIAASRGARSKLRKEECLHEARHKAWRTDCPKHIKFA
jgi:hypothetical protein